MKWRIVSSTLHRIAQPSRALSATLSNSFPVCYYPRADVLRRKYFRSPMLVCHMFACPEVDKVLATSNGSPGMLAA
jgi:hypothetical protein